MGSQRETGLVANTMIDEGCEDMDGYGDTYLGRVTRTAAGSGTVAVTGMGTGPDGKHCHWVIGRRTVTGLVTETYTRGLAKKKGTCRGSCQWQRIQTLRNMGNDGGVYH